MTRLRRAMYHKDLQSAYFAGRIVTWIARRNWGLRMMQRFGMKPMVGNQIKGLANDEIFIPSVPTPGHKIRARVYKPKGVTGPLPAMIYAHGGGYQVGVPEQAHPFFQDLIARRDVVIVAPAYRLSLDGHPYPHGLNDCFDTLMYMKDNAADLGIRDDAFIVGGHSGGGGMAAALTLKTLDAKAAHIAFQMPIYPMLDHRMETKSGREMIGSAVWDRRSNALAWTNYLGHLNGNVPDHASPALREDLTGHPPTISFVGDMEPFKDETIAYINALDRAGVPTKFKLYEGGFHGFETVAPKAPISKDAMAFQADAFAEYYDTYL
ncbi:alpha/beta hydrolase [Pseudooctadecabacter jejudonensis]|uniref:Carboxylesterase NlhH n=1 Tax=Pseudooctadecabacter jejudonensis TaxID=1391910 RepID=A0A1Y5SA12_9RHOB|nr:alpha/beta hydrolase fold domain-containing protein [Pseudooctadecabacter jejudonensis]SLN34763.1 Carboxylesterase NlhH [Pseudooctadecabacter jejudonensis]